MAGIAEDCSECGRHDERLKTVEKQTEQQWTVINNMNRKLSMILGAACLAPILAPFILALINFVLKSLATSAAAAGF